VIYSRRLNLKDLAERLGCRLDGDGEIEVVRLARITDAGPGDLTFLSNTKYTAALAHTQASAVILGDDAPAAPCAMLRTRDPYLAFARAMSLFAGDAPAAPGVSDLASVAPDVILGTGVSIGPFVYIGAGAVIGARTIIHPHVTIGPHVVVGDDCLLYPQASVRERCRLGHRVILQNGAVIGSDGFGFATRPDGTHEKIPQVAIVVLEDDVEIGANTAVDRPAVGETRVGAGSKIDNLVQVAHGVQIGRHVLIAGQSGIAGSTSIGDSVILAAQVGVAGHLHVGAGTRATGQTGIPGSVPDRSFVSGSPAIEHREWLKASAVFRRLPELKRTVAVLERRLAELEARLSPRAPSGD
jgi:UDP-3-O-[3-hydroxymyristoyl] glucosamine N-acyltransferase